MLYLNLRRLPVEFEGSQAREHDAYVELLSDSVGVPSTPPHSAGTTGGEGAARLDGLVPVSSRRLPSRVLVSDQIRARHLCLSKDTV